MRNINVRDVVPDDAQKFIEYEMGTAGNLFDPKSELYKSAFTLCAENEQGPVVFMPVQVTFTLESLGIAPDADKRDVALSLRKIINEVVARAKGTNVVQELYCVCSDESTKTFMKHHQFEELPYTLYRLKVKDYQAKS